MNKFQKFTIGLIPLTIILSFFHFSMFYVGSHGHFKFEVFLMLLYFLFQTIAVVLFLYLHFIKALPQYYNKMILFVKIIFPILILITLFLDMEVYTALNKNEHINVNTTMIITSVLYFIPMLFGTYIVLFRNKLLLKNKIVDKGSV